MKRALAAGGVALGTMVFEFNTSGVARAAAAAGAEFIIFDMEHSGWSVETVRTLIACSGGSGLVPMVRVPATQYHLIARPLDVGAMGIMVPNVESEEQARTIVRSAKYPPEGARGAGFGLAHDDYRIGDPLDKAAGFMASDVETAKQALARGFRFIAYWGDVWLYQQALRQGLEGIRAQLAVGC